MPVWVQIPIKYRERWDFLPDGRVMILACRSNSDRPCRTDIRAKPRWLMSLGFIFETSFPSIILAWVRKDGVILALYNKLLDLLPGN